MRDKQNRGRDISRRKFLQGISAGTIATIVAGSRGFSGTAFAESVSGNSGMSVQIRRSRVPVLRKGNVIILGGSVAAVAAALQFARNGSRVVLVEHRNY